MTVPRTICTGGPDLPQPVDGMMAITATPIQARAVPRSVQTDLDEHRRDSQAKVIDMADVSLVK